MLCLGDMQDLIGLSDGLLMVDSLPVSAADMGALIGTHSLLTQTKTRFKFDLT